MPRQKAAKTAGCNADAFQTFPSEAGSWTKESSCQRRPPQPTVRTSFFARRRCRGWFSARSWSGHHTDPSREPVVRVDDNEAFVGAEALTSDEIVGQLKTGTTARIRYWPFPRGPEDATVDLSGFVEAYELLLEKVQALRQSRRPQ
jgi:hypothetical protein